MLSFRRSLWGVFLAALAVGGCQTPAGPPATVSPATSALEFTPVPPTESAQSQPGGGVTATAVPGPPSTPTPACTEPNGRVIEDSYPGVAVADEIPLLVYLPPCYAEGGTGYPTVYLLHGLPYDERHWLRLGSVQRIDSGIANGEWNPLVLVMPYQPEPLFTASDGGPGSYEQEFLEGVVSYVERSYAVDPERRGLAGISRGGIWALEIAFRNPQEVTVLAALSPALAVNSARPAYDPLELARSADRFPEAILLLAGEDDWAAVKTAELSRILLDRQIAHQHRVVPGDHSDPTWAGALGVLFEYLSAALGQP